MFLRWIDRAAWPDGIDLAIVATFLVAALGLPAAGYVFMVVDYRAWRRTLRRALVVVARALPGIPAWAFRDNPPYLRALGLALPCTEEDVKRAYRRLAERLHPDRGGDKRRFLIVHEHFEKALAHVRRQG